MPKKPVKQQQEVDIIEIEEYPQDGSDSEEDVSVQKSTKKKPKAKKQVKVEAESESESESESEEEVPQKKKSSKKKSSKSPKGMRSKAIPVIQAPVKKPLTEKRAAALARGREKQRLLREQRKNESLEKMKKELWEDFQKQGKLRSAGAGTATERGEGTVKENKENKEPIPDPLEHIKKMKESLPKQDERKHDVGGLFGPVQIRSFRK